MAKKRIQTLPETAESFSTRGTPGAKEAQLIALAYDCVEKKLRDGTATSQETTYFLKLGSEQAALEKRQLEERIKLLEAQTKSLAAAEKLEAMYDDVINAVLSYRSPVTSGESYQDRHND